MAPYDTSASQVLDGITVYDNTVVNCFITDGEYPYQWMTLEYPLEVTLKQIDIYKRHLPARFRDIEIRIGNTRVPKDLKERITFNNFCDSIVGSTTNNPEIFKCSQPYPKGKYISVQFVKAPKEHLEIVEVVTHFEE